MSIAAVAVSFFIAFSGIGLPLPFSLRKRATYQLKAVANDFNIEVLPAPLLPTNTVILDGFSAVGAKGILICENRPKLVMRNVLTSIEFTVLVG